jgi:hypothetical protein
MVFDYGTIEGDEGRGTRKAGNQAGIAWIVTLSNQPEATDVDGRYN